MIETVYSPEAQKTIDEWHNLLRSFDEIFLAVCIDQGMTEQHALEELRECQERKDLVNKIVDFVRLQTIVGIIVSGDNVKNIVGKA